MGIDRRAFLNEGLPVVATLSLRFVTEAAIQKKERCDRNSP